MIRYRIAIFVLCLFGFGCGGEESERSKILPGLTPASATFEKSTVKSQGKCAVIKNLTDEELVDVVVTVKRLNGSAPREFKLGNIPANETVKVGSDKLENWELGPLDILEIQAKGFPKPRRISVPRSVDKKFSK